MEKLQIARLVFLKIYGYGWLLWFSATEQLRGELHKSEALLITIPLLVVKAKNTYQTTIKMHKTMETELSH